MDMKSGRTGKILYTVKRLLIFICIAALAIGEPAFASESSSDTRGLLEGYLEGFMSAIGGTRYLRDAEIEKIPDQTWTGRSVKPAIRIFYYGTRLRKGTDYTVTFTDNRNLGTAKAKITGKGKYSGTRTVSFKIVRKNGSSGSSSSGSSSSGGSSSKKTSGKTFKITLSKNTYTYNGEYRKPTVKVTLGNKSVTSGNYTVRYTDNKNVGTATVTVTGKGDYSGCKGIAKFTIEMKKPVISSVKSSSEGELNVSWNRDSQADGYQIQYSTRKNFSANDKIKYVRGYRTVSADITGLPSGKKYYVRMRSYKNTGSRNTYSAWSTVKEKVVK